MPMPMEIIDCNDCRYQRKPGYKNKQCNRECDSYNQCHEDFTKWLEDKVVIDKERITNFLRIQYYFLENYIEWTVDVDTYVDDSIRNLKQNSEVIK